jgi:hypothetical protein
VSHRGHSSSLIFVLVFKSIDRLLCSYRNCTSDMIAVVATMASRCTFTPISICMASLAAFSGWGITDMLKAELGAKYAAKPFLCQCKSTIRELLSLPTENRII